MNKLLHPSRLLFCMYFTIGLVAMIPLLCLLHTEKLSAQSAAGEGWSVDDPAGPTTLLQYTATEGTWMSLDVSPDGQTLVFDLLGHLYELPVEGGNAYPLTEGRSWNLSPRYSPDGTLIAFSSDQSGSHDIWTLNRSTGERQNITNSNENWFRPAWYPDGQRLLSQMTVWTLSGEQTSLAGNRSGTGRVRPDGEGIWLEHRGAALHPFGFNPYTAPAGGWRVEHLDLTLGEITTHIERPGGAFNPDPSPDGTRLAYLHRDIDDTVLMLQDLETRTERVLVRGLDIDRQEGGGHAGPWPNIAWHPDSDRIFLSWGGSIRSVDVETAQVQTIPFHAPVQRDITRRPEITVELPGSHAATRHHRWGSRTGGDILFETLGDVWLMEGDQSRNLTRSETHETSPVRNPQNGTLYYASWSDRDLGAVIALQPDGTARRLTTAPSQFGSLALSSDGSKLAYVRGSGALQRGRSLSDETHFELVVHDGEREQVVATLRGSELQYANFASKIPPHVSFDPDGETVVFSEFVRDTLVLRRTDPAGGPPETLVRLPYAVEVSLSPDRKWIAFREYNRSFLTPHEPGQPAPVITAWEEKGLTLRIDSEDGGYFNWSPDSQTLQWTRAGSFYEKHVDEIVAEDERDGLTSAQREAHADEWLADRIPGSTAQKTDLSIRFPVYRSEEAVALTGVRAITMNSDRETLENAIILIRNGEIESIDAGLDVPDGYHVFDLSGHTVIPGIVDAHAHPHIEHPALHIIEQNPPYLRAPLAYGITTMMEVYGNEHRDGWIADMLLAGKITGPRLFTTGSPIYGRRTGRNRMYRPVTSLAAAREQVRWNRDHGAIAVKDYVQTTRKPRHETIRAAREQGLYTLSESASNPQMNLTQLLDGIAGLEHSMALDTFYEDMVRFWRASGAGITPTLGVLYGGPMGEGWFHQREKLWEDEKLTRFIPPQHLMRIRRSTHLWREDFRAPEMAAAMHRLYRAGVPVLLGGHGQMMGLDVHWELEMLVMGGFSPHQALEAATIQGATHHGLGHALGSLEPGKRADLVVLRENPLQDIRHSRTIRYVIRDGIVYSGEDASRVWPDPEPSPPIYYRVPDAW